MDTKLFSCVGQLLTQGNQKRSTWEKSCPFTPALFLRAFSKWWCREIVLLGWGKRSEFTAAEITGIGGAEKAESSREGTSKTYVKIPLLCLGKWLWAIMMRTNYVLCRHKIYWSLSTSRYLSKITESRILRRYVYTHIQCSVMHKSQEVEARQMLSIDEWITKTWSIHTMKCYSAFKGKEILTYTATWMNLENIKLSEIS